MPIALFDERLKKDVLEVIKKPRLRIERAVILTNSYQETEGEPMIIRRAEALLKYAREIPISIEDWQLIVGSPSADNFTLSPFPESTWDWICELDDFETRDGDRYHITEEDKGTLRELLPWWKGKSIEDNVYKRIPINSKKAHDSGLIRSGYVDTGCGNFMLDYRRILQDGIEKIKQDVESRFEDLDLTKPENYQKWLFYRAALISCEAIQEYAKRFAILARELTEKETDQQRKEDLQIIAENCDRVPFRAATNFPQALQSIWFIHCLTHFEIAGGAAVVFGRMDQYLYPYYIEYSKGDDEAKRWLTNFWINQNQLMYFLPKKTSAAIWSGHPVSEQPSIGGMTKEGKDASNELTKLILEIEREVGLPRPDIALLYHRNIDQEVLRLACDALPKAMKPKIFNHDILCKQLIAKGATLEEARDQGVVIGCVSSGIEGKVFGNNQMSFVNLGKALELTLNNGIDQLSGQKAGPSTGDIKDFKDFRQLMNAFKDQLVYAIRMAVTLAIVIEDVHKTLNPQPFASVFINDCIEKGLPVWEGGVRYSIPGFIGVGLANVADALAAIKKLVFERGEVQISELITALHDDWKTDEALRQKFINSAPKFGNDDDYVDEIAAEVARFYCEEVGKYTSPRGVPYYPGLYSVSAHVALGEYVGATPDGRKARTPLADGMSPSQGFVFQGPTALIRSMVKIDHSLATNGTLQNMKFSLSTVRRHRDKFIAAIRTYMELGGYHVQFNIIDTATLRNALNNPEQYSGLVVRVAAYSAEFTALPRGLQEDIIARTELDLA